MRKIDRIIIHCTATPQGREVTVGEVDRWHRARGFSGIGYHYLIGLDGNMRTGRSVKQAGAHCEGQNAHSIGVCYVGGLAADVGAGTGIWSSMLYEAGLKVVAVEPNEAMRREGSALNPGFRWAEGSAENTGLPGGIHDLVSMASSFHWADFNLALKEFHRILKPGGYFLALWNTRDTEYSPLLKEIESKIHELIPDLNRVSSGASVFCDNLTDRLDESDSFIAATYLEGRHVERQTPERYLGLWKSVNDVRVQAGEEKFKVFLDFVESKTKGLSYIEARYKTRAWIARRAD
jgi:SAM-dependent methyltransferase